MAPDRRSGHGIEPQAWRQGRACCAADCRGLRHGRKPARGHALSGDCCLDAGNLAHVAKALRSVYPAALLVLCGDEDMQTLAQSGHNFGREKATAAARAVRGLTVFPDDLPDGGLDFNDLHQAAGLDAVRTIVLAAIDAHQASQFNAQAAQNEKTGKCGHSPRSERIEAQNAGGF